MGWRTWPKQVEFNNKKMQATSSSSLASLTRAWLGPAGDRTREKKRESCARSLRRRRWRIQGHENPPSASSYSRFLFFHFSGLFATQTNFSLPILPLFVGLLGLFSLLFFLLNSIKQKESMSVPDVTQETSIAQKNIYKQGNKKIKISISTVRSYKNKKC